MHQAAPIADSALRVTAKTLVAQEVTSITLKHPKGHRLPDWAPGAHIDLILPNAETRQYSLCGDRWDAYSYRVGVLRDSASRGGSIYIHDELAVGDLVRVGGPRNNFPMVPAPLYLFIAGGIGITPLISMIAQAQLMGIEWHLLYGGRTRSSMAFCDELRGYGDRVVIAPRDECGRLDLTAWLHRAEAEDSKVYVCGPNPLLAAAEAHCALWPAGKLRIERFVPKQQRVPVRSNAFDVELARTGRTMTVTPESSILDAVRSAGANVLSSCGQGTCGTCETRVLSGVPDHRDSIFDDTNEAQDRMLICVSRSRTDRLVLDL